MSVDQSLSFVDVESLSDALGRATPGPWRAHDFGHAGMDEPCGIVVFSGEEFDWQAVDEGEYVAMFEWERQGSEDAHFICLARTLLPRMLEERAALLARIHELQGGPHAEDQHA